MGGLFNLGEGGHDKGTLVKQKWLYLLAYESALEIELSMLVSQGTACLTHYFLQSVLKQTKKLPIVAIEVIIARDNELVFTINPNHIYVYARVCYQR